MTRRVEGVGVFGRAPDPRPSVDIEGDILDELRFHIEERTADNVAAGMALEEARADAERRFGDFGRIRAACRKVQLGERIMLQRINFVAVLVLLAAVVVFGYQAVRAQRSAGVQVAAMRAEMNDQMDLMLALLAEQAAIDDRAAASPTGRRLNTGEGTLGKLLSDRERARGASPSSDRAEVEVPFDPRAWLVRVPPVDADWRTAAALGAKIAALDADRAIEVLETIWSAVENPGHRQQLLKHALQGPHLLRAMHLGATDDDPAVRGWAYGYLENVAFMDMSEDPGLYDAWHQRFAGLPLDEVIATSAADFVQRMNLLDGDALAKGLRQFDRLDLRMGEEAGLDMARVFRDAGVLSMIERWIRTGTSETRVAGLEWLSGFEPTEQELRDLALPILTDPVLDDGTLHDAACRALGRRGQAWAVEPLVGFMQESLQGETDEVSAGLWSGAMALAEIRDHRAIPDLIGMIAGDDSYNTVYGVGYFGLRELTGVSYDESHDGAWWLAWWDANRHRYPAEVAALDVPQ